MSTHKLYVIDDDEAVRRSLGLLLLSRGHAVQAFASGEAFLEGAALDEPGVAILDLRLDGLSGLQVFDALRQRASPLVVVFLSGHGDIPVAVQAVQDGAFGWLEKPCSDERLLETVEKALARAAEIATRLQARQAALALWQRLTPREMQVARLVAEGHANKRIAQLLAPIEPRTVETHRAHVFAKLALANSHELERFIREHGL
ncbi:response regulator transcription factor [Pelomonas sp. KK5]|uniref:response regulator transcription factor n=1 Tax=Pelomonas sp. KK5 TaxID=1855730 RepID=UPI0018E9660F|nr:response regulator [Pelomonas sp. KK5]